MKKVFMSIFTCVQIFSDSLCMDDNKTVTIIQEYGNCTNLMLYVRSKNLEGIKREVEEKKTNIDECDILLQTPTHYAAMFNLEEILQYLLNHGANVNARNDHLRTPLFLAVISRSILAIKVLLNHPNIEVDCRDVSGNTPLHIAGEIGNEIIIELLLQHGANINTQNCSLLNTSLHNAIELNRESCVETLLRYNPNIFITNFRKRFAMEKGYSSDRIYKKLLSYEKSLSSENRQVMIDNATNLFIQMDNGKNLLVAMKNRNKLLIDFFLYSFKNCLMRDEYGFSALDYCIRNDWTSILNLCIGTGEEVNTADKNGNTPLHNAVIFNNEIALLYLLKYNPILTVTNRDGYTPLALARALKRSELVKILEEKCGDAGFYQRRERTIFEYDLRRKVPLFQAFESLDFWQPQVFSNYDINKVSLSFFGSE